MTSIRKGGHQEFMVASSILDPLPLPIALFNANKELIYVNNVYYHWFTKLQTKTSELPDIKHQINTVLSNELTTMLDEVLLGIPHCDVKEVTVRTSITGHKNLKVSCRKYTLQDNTEGVSIVFENDDPKEDYYALYKHQAHIDPLTGVCNRFGFYEAFSTMRQQVTCDNLIYCVLVADIDDLKRINDSKGHLLGDDAIRLAAECLSNCLREDDILCRWGGDEFIVVIVSKFSIQHLEKLIKQLLDRIISTMSSHGSGVQLSIGSAIYQVNGDSLDQLINYADKAMYDEKRKKHNSK